MKSFEQFGLDSEIITSTNMMHLVVKGYPSVDSDNSIVILNEYIPIGSLPWNTEIDNFSDKIYIVVEQLKNKIFASMFIDDALLYEEIHEINS